ncbi:MAG: TonB-dependent receptor [Chitinophagaceae bacterium]|nr:TonB-dependent receptor [Chitinophagaceae bacterium]
MNQNAYGNAFFIKRYVWAQTLLYMKLTALLLFVACLHVSARTYSQKVSLSGKNISLEQVFEMVKAQTGYDAIYNPDLLKKTKRITIDVKNADLTEVLQYCFRDQPASFLIRYNTIVVTTRLEEKKVVPTNAVNSEEDIPLLQIDGRVVSEAGESLAGVSIAVKGTAKGTTTGADGGFSIDANPGDVLVISFVGHVTQEITVTQNKNLSIKLQQVVNEMDQVVVVGYGVQSRKDIASSISRVSEKDFKNANISTINQALQGRTTGVQVVETSGEPGAAAVVRIRGNNSLSGSNEPLYVIDGFPMPPYREATANFTGSFAQNGLYGINPNDIESMEVLKDASATAIYGSRGANGVVLITTKAGKRGEGRVELVNKTSFGAVANPVKMMNGRQYAEIINEFWGLYQLPPIFPNLDTTFANTDWFDLITRPSFRQDISLSVSGGSPKSSYYISGNYLLDKGTIISSDNGRGSLRVNLNNDVNSWYTVKTQLSFVRQKNNRAITTGRAWPDAGGLMDGIRASPTVAKDYLGTNSWGFPGEFAGYYFSNYYHELNGKTDISKNDYSILNIENWFNITKDLKLVVTLGGNQNLTRRQVFLPVTTAAGNGVNGKGSNTMSNTYSYNVNGYFLYEKTFQQDHKLNVTLGAEYNNQTTELLNTSSSGFDIPYFGVDNIGSARTQGIGSYKEERTLQSGFFRGNYSYKDRYVLNTSVRLDGASPFAANKKYGLFPAVALAWNMDSEDFMRSVTFVTNTKWRVSYGETGSQAINPYSSLAQYGSGFYELGANSTVVTALYPTGLGNANLSWERTRQFNAGLDFSVFSNRLGVSFDYYNKTTVDLLQSRVLPAQSGFGSIIANYGSMRNRGVELSLQADIIRSRSFRYNTRLNLSHNKTILLNLGDRTSSDYTTIGGNLQGGVAAILTPGKEVGRFFGYKVTGLAQPSDFNTNGTPDYPYAGSAADHGPGTWKYEDLDKSGKINADDRQVLGKSSPDFIFGWTNDITWKNFGLNLFFTGSVGNDVLNLTQFYLNSGMINYAGMVFNQSEDWYLNRWTPANPHNNPRYPGTQKTAGGITDINSAMLEDGSYFRLKLLALSYQFPDIAVIKNPRLFVTGTNVLTFTKYTGFDPEVSSYGEQLLRQGIDYGAYPAQRSFTIGFSCNF